MQASLDAIADHLAAATPHSAPEVDMVALNHAHRSIQKLMRLVRKHRVANTLPECAVAAEVSLLDTMPQLKQHLNLLIMRPFTLALVMCGSQTCSTC